MKKIFLAKMPVAVRVVAGIGLLRSPAFSMLAHGTRFLAFSIALLGLGTSAQAAPKLYSATLFYRAFDSGTAIPLGGFCNGNYTVPTGTMKIATVYPAPNGSLATHCGATTIAQGAPFTGSGTASVSQMGFRSFTLPSKDIGGTRSGSFPYSFPYIYEVTQLALSNYPGYFYTGGGPGSTSSLMRTFPHPGGARITAGKNQFGGTMRMLGNVTSTGLYVTLMSQGFFAPTWPWLFELAGASYRGGDCSVMNVSYCGASATTAIVTLADSSRNRAYTLMGLYPLTAISKIYADAFRWTTGTAYVRATAGPFRTTLSEMGYDNRTTMGSYGTIQFVTPHLVNGINPVRQASTGAIAILNIQFLPEPQGWVLLAVGVGVLVSLARVSRRR